MKVNPLSYGLGALRRVLYGEAMADSLGDPSLLSSLGVTVGFAVLTMAVAVWMAGRPEKN
ncbi:MAG: ABC transporter, partial [SAR324 cluster bacterium]|nr:ABC transporter [SAR324 cluster bacterium]